MTFGYILYIIVIALVGVVVLKWNKHWLLKQKDGMFSFDEDIVFSKDSYEHIYNLIEIKNVNVSGTGTFNEHDQKVYIDVKVTGIFIVPCALSLEPVDYPFESESTEVFTFVKPNVDEEEHKAIGDTIDLTPVIFQNIIMEIPMRVVKPGIEVATEGKGWSLVSDQEEIDNLEIIDPRLAKLKDYFKDKE